jgi:hypothetical protein
LVSVKSTVVGLVRVEQDSSDIAVHCTLEEVGLIYVARVVGSVAGDESYGARVDVVLVVGLQLDDFA